MEKKKITIEPWQVIAVLLLLYDLFVTNVSYLFVLWLRFDAKVSHMPERYCTYWKGFVPVYSAIVISLFYIFHLYKMLWMYAGLTELIYIFAASFTASLFHAVGITLMYGSMPISYYILGAILQFILVAFIRFAFRVYAAITYSRTVYDHDVKRVMIIGAGKAGEMILRDLKKSKEVNCRYKPVCFIDQEI